MIIIIIANCLKISIMFVMREKKSKEIIKKPIIQANLNMYFLGVKITINKKIACTTT